MRIFWLFNHPAPYKVAFFSSLGKKCELTVFYERDKEGGRNASFYEAPSESYQAIIGKPFKLGPYDSYSGKPLRYLRHHDQYDLIVLNGWSTLTERRAISYCKQRHIPYVFYVNGGIIPSKESGIKRAYKTSFISGASFYLAPDPASKEYLLHYGAKEDLIHLYPYGSVSEKEVLAKPYARDVILRNREKLVIEGEKAFVSTGFFIKRKGFDALIAFWKDMPQTHHLYLIGEGPEEKKLLKQIQERSLHNVHILPYKKHEELFRFYRACDAFLFPTKEDIYGHVVTEALSQGLPVYATDKSNAAKLLIQEGVNGGIVDFADLTLAARLSQIDFDALREAAIASAKPYTYEASAQAHLDLFKELLQA